MDTINLCQPESLGISCFGCCGNSYKSRKELIKGIEKNTIEYLKTNGDIEKFLDKPTSVRDCGLCRNIVLHSENQVFCPLHPLVNEGADYRDKDCNKRYNCKTKKAFESWDKNKQKEFLAFIKEKNPDYIEFSINIDNNKFLKEFKRKKTALLKKKKL